MIVYECVQVVIEDAIGFAKLWIEVGQLKLDWDLRLNEGKQLEVFWIHMMLIILQFLFCL